MGLSNIFSATARNPLSRVISVATRHLQLSMRYPRWYSKGKWPRFSHGMITNGAIAAGSAIWQRLWPKKNCELAPCGGSDKPSMANRRQLTADFREVISVSGYGNSVRAVEAPRDARAACHNDQGVAVR